MCRCPPSPPRPPVARSSSARCRVCGFALSCPPSPGRQYILGAVLRSGGYSRKELEAKDKEELYKLRIAALKRMVRSAQRLHTRPPLAAAPVTDSFRRRRGWLCLSVSLSLSHS